MRGLNIGEVVLLAAIATLLLLTPYAIRYVKASARRASVATRQTSPSGAAAASPVRFVKDPEMAPAFQLRDLSGNMVSTADWKGKVVLLAFWATWCPPCREEIPELISLQQKYKDRLQVVGISEDDDPPEKVLQFAQQKGINYPIVMVTNDLVTSYGGVPALPTTFVIDTQGRVVQKHTGLAPLDAYDREVRALLGLLPAGTPIETFVDNGQVFLKNVANATDLPGVNLSGLTAPQKKEVLHRLNAESCTCGCALTMAQCRVNDTTCPVSQSLAAHVVSEVVHGTKAKPAPPATVQN